MLLTITTFRELEEVVTDYRRKDYSCLIVTGFAGLSKTTIVRQVLGDAAIWITGNASPFRFYADLYHARKNAIVCLDDVDSLFRKPEGVQILKQVCQTEKVKTVGWHTQSIALEREGIPRSFNTTARVVLLSNDRVGINRHLSPVVDRGLMLTCDFSPEEVHRYAASWFTDKVVYAWIGKHLRLIRYPSLRHYIVASDLRRGGKVDWRRALLETWGVTRHDVTLLEILDNPKYSKQEDRVAEYVRRTGLSRPTFFRRIKDLPHEGNNEAAEEDREIYETPPEAVSLLLEHEGFEGEILEPCCASGRIVDVLQDAGYEVASSDIRTDDEIAGEKGIDFFDITEGIDNIVTNPPYSVAERAARHFLTLARHKVALLLPLYFLEAVGRKEFFEAHPPTRVWVLSRRPKLFKKGTKTEGGRSAFGWFVWDVGSREPTILRRI